MYLGITKYTQIHLIGLKNYQSFTANSLSLSLSMQRQTAQLNTHPLDGTSGI